MSAETFNAIYDVVKTIPQGKVTTYGAIAKQLGINPRVVGYALHSSPEAGVIPCHRVVFKDGSLAKGFAFGGEDVQRAILEKEGVGFNPDSKVKTAYVIKFFAGQLYCR